MVMYMNIMRQSLSDNDVNFNWDHYRNVRNAKREKGEELNHSIKVDHIEGTHLKVNSPLFSKIDNRYVYISEIHKHWYRGWYYSVVYYRLYEQLGEMKKSHGTLWIKNISCHDKTVLQAIKENSEEYNIK